MLILSKIIFYYQITSGTLAIYAPLPDGDNEKLLGVVGKKFILSTKYKLKKSIECNLWSIKISLRGRGCIKCFNWKAKLRM